MEVLKKVQKALLQARADLDCAPRLEGVNCPAEQAALDEAQECVDRAKATLRVACKAVDVAAQLVSRAKTAAGQPLPDKPGEHVTNPLPDDIYDEACDQAWLKWIPKSKVVAARLRRARDATPNPMAGGGTIADKLMGVVCSNPVRGALLASYAKHRDRDRLIREMQAQMSKYVAALPGVRVK